MFILKSGIKINWFRKKHIKLSFMFFVFAAGSLLHILLDVVIRDGSRLFFPFSDFLLGFNIIFFVPISEDLVLIGIDTILLFFWIFWMEFKLKVDDYF